MQDGERVVCLGMEKLGQMKSLPVDLRSEPGGGGRSQVAASGVGRAQHSAVWPVSFADRGLTFVLCSAAF